MFEFICKGKDVDLVAHEAHEVKRGAEGWQGQAMTSRDERFASSSYTRAAVMSVVEKGRVDVGCRLPSC